MIDDKRIKKFTLIRIYVPLANDGDYLSRTSEDTMVKNENLRGLFKVIKRTSFAGLVGEYTGVFEILGGFEGYIPGEDSNPTHGEPGKESVVQSVAVTTYVPETTSQHDLILFLEELTEAHPWEHPVIEIINSEGVYLWDPLSK